MFTAPPFDLRSRTARDGLQHVSEGRCNAVASSHVSASRDDTPLSLTAPPTLAFVAVVAAAGQLISSRPIADIQTQAKRLRRGVLQSSATSGHEILRRKG